MLLFLSFLTRSLSSTIIFKSFNLLLSLRPSWVFSVYSKLEMSRFILSRASKVIFCFFLLSNSSLASFMPSKYSSKSLSSYSTSQVSLKVWNSVMMLSISFLTVSMTWSQIFLNSSSISDSMASISFLISDNKDDVSFVPRVSLDITSSV